MKKEVVSNMKKMILKKVNPNMKMKTFAKEFKEISLHYPDCFYDGDTNSICVNRMSNEEQIINHTLDKARTKKFWNNLGIKCIN